MTKTCRDGGIGTGAETSGDSKELRELVKRGQTAFGRGEWWIDCGSKSGMRMDLGGLEEK